MSEKLEGLFLHYSTAEESEAELSAELKAEIERLTNVIGDWSRKLGGLPPQRHPSHLINICDEAISQALRSSESSDYATAFAHLQQASRAIFDIQIAWQANLDYEAAKEAYAALESLFPSSRVQLLLTVRNLALLMEESLSLFQRGKYTQGRLLVRACRIRSETLSRHQSTTAAAATLRARLNQLLALCDEVSRFLPLGQADWADKRALRDIDMLLQEQRLILAERLLDDLEVELTPHRTFLTLYRELGPANAQPASSSFVQDDDLRELIAAQSWSAATSYLLSGRLQELSAMVAKTSAETKLIQQQIAVYRKSPAPAGARRQ